MPWNCRQERNWRFNSHVEQRPPQCCRVTRCVGEVRLLRDDLEPPEAD